MINDFDITIGGVEFATVAHVQDADYSWSAEAILKRKTDGALFYVTDAGCSCNSFGEFLDLADLEPIFSVDEGLRRATDRRRMEQSIETHEAVWR